MGIAVQYIPKPIGSIRRFISRSNVTALLTRLVEGFGYLLTCSLLIAFHISGVLWSVAPISVTTERIPAW